MGKIMKRENGSFTRIAERSSGNVIIPVLDQELIETKKRQLFGDLAEAIHPEIVEVMAEAVASNSDITLDDETREVLAYASESGLNSGFALEKSLQALTATVQEGLHEVSVYGPGGDYIRELEQATVSLVDQEQAEVLPVADVFVAETIAKNPEQIIP